MTNLRRFLPLLTLWLACYLTFASSAAFAQFSGVIEGTIIGAEGTPLVGAMIAIERKDVKIRLEVKTNKKGYYVHAGLSPGLYRISVNWEGKEIYFFDNTRVISGDTVTLNLNLKEELEKQKTTPREATPEEKEVEAKVEAAKTKHETMKARFEKGSDFLKAKQYDQAIEEFKAAAEMDPRQYAIFANLGEAYRGLRKFDESIQSYKQALTVLAERPNPQVEASYHMNLALVYATAGDMANASAETQKAAELNPVLGSKAYYNLGATLVNSGKAEDAITAFQKAIEIDPTNAEAHYQMGISLMSKAQITPDGKTIPAPGTVEAFQKYLQLQPNGPNAATAKNMIEMLGSTIETKFSAEKEKKKK
ncbi:MAG: tetratricopeptide repeat protein [Terriglobia bacterium]